MESILKLFETQASLNSMFQIGIDVIMLGMLAMIMVVKKPRISKKDEAIMESFDKIVEETAAVSQSFEINLGKRQELLKQLTAKLDQRIREAQDLCARLEQLPMKDTSKLADQNSSSPAPRSRNSDQQKVLFLAGKGLDAAEIAKNIKRPVGEVELILNLQKIAT
jgi:hypothetical protein